MGGISGAIAPIIKNMGIWIVGALVIAVIYGIAIYYLKPRGVAGKKLRSYKDFGGIITACVLAAWTFYILF